jgi:hypothetical protein
MDMTSQLPLLDRLKAATERQRVELRRAGAVVISGVSGGAMRFQVGDRVIDTATGKSGTIRIGERRAGGAGELYGVDLSDGRVLFRGGDELAPDLPAATV